MYFFEKARLGLPVFVKSNGIQMFVGNRRVSKITIVWWMPTNWVVFPILLALLPFFLVVDYYKKETHND